MAVAVGNGGPTLRHSQGIPRPGGPLGLMLLLSPFRTSWNGMPCCFDRIPITTGGGRRWNGMLLSPPTLRPETNLHLFPLSLSKPADAKGYSCNGLNAPTIRGWLLNRAFKSEVNPIGSGICDGGGTWARRSRSRALPHLAKNVYLSVCCPFLFAWTSCVDVFPRPFCTVHTR